MKLNEIYTSNYIKVEDLKRKKHVVVIENVSVEQVGEDRKLVATFEGRDKGLVLNRTNANMIGWLTGSEDTDDWLGVAITIKPSRTEFQGRTVDCIRVDDELPAQRNGKSKPPESPADREYEEEAAF